MSNYTNKDTISAFNLRILGDEKCNAIVDAAYQILEDYGFKVALDENDEMKKIIESMGGSVKDSIIYLPREVVKKGLELTPKEITLYSNDGQPAMELSSTNGKTYLGVGLFPPLHDDVYTGERRDSNVKDCFQGGLVCEALENVDYITGLSYPLDCTHLLSGLYEVRALLETSKKPFHYTDIDWSVMPYFQEMAAAVKGSWEKFLDEPFCTFCTGIDLGVHFIECMKLGDKVPLMLLSTPLAGASSPTTIAGTLAAGLSEILANIAVVQYLHPGQPCIPHLYSDTICFKNASFAATSPESVLSGSCGAELFRYLGLPSVFHYGKTDSPILDQQAAFDFSVQFLMAKLTGVSIASFAGYLESCMAGSLESLTLDNELMSYYNSLMHGVEVNDDTLALDVMEKIGVRGDYMSDMHTFNHVHDYWNPDLFIRGSLKQFKEAGGKDTAQRANEKIRKIIDAGVKNPKDPAIIAKLDEILERAEKDVKDGKVTPMIWDIQ